MIEIKEIITDNKDLEYIKECAESVGMDVTDRTAFSIPFIAEVMRRMNKFNRSKEVYNKGYDDGREALAFHLELCKDEGSIIEIPEGATNGDMIKALFPNCVIDEDFGGAVITNVDDKQYWRKDWWNSPYRIERSKYD